jgi:hypothetical protein
MPESNADTLSNILKRSSPVGAPPKSADPGPDEAEPDALTIAEMGTSIRPANKNLTRIHVVRKNGDIESFQYHFSDVRGTFKGSEFVIIFAGTKHWQLNVRGSGPDFWRAYDLITLHRLPYLREATENEAKFAAKDATIFAEVKIADITPKNEV